MNSTAPPEDYLPFELIVDSRAAHGYPVSVIESPAGEGSDYADFALDAPTTGLLQALLDGRSDPTSLRQLGQWLFGRVFGGSLGILYRSSLAIARREGKRLRLRLRIVGLTWEAGQRQRVELSAPCSTRSLGPLIFLEKRFCGKG